MPGTRTVAPRVRMFRGPFWFLPRPRVTMRSRERPFRLSVFAMCLVPRAAAVFIWPAQSTYYWELADNLARGHGFALERRPVTFMEPLYPAFLAVLKRVTNDNPLGCQTLLQAAIGADRRRPAVAVQRTPRRWSRRAGHDPLLRSLSVRRQSERACG